MKKLIVVTVIAACLILCAAVWPQPIPIEETPVVPPLTTEVAPRSEMLEAPETDEIIAPEEKAVEIPPLEAAHDIIIEPDPTPDPMPTIPETQVIAELEPEPADVPAASVIHPTPEPQSTPVPAPSQTVINPQPDDMVYVPGFGWLECQDPGEVIHDESIYENGNKIGVMG